MICYVIFGEATISPENKRSIQFIGLYKTEEHIHWRDWSTVAWSDAFRGYYVISPLVPKELYFPPAFVFFLDLLCLLYNCNKRSLEFLRIILKSKITINPKAVNLL